MIIHRYYPGEPVNIHMQSLINVVQDNNWLITTKKGKGKLPLFCGNGERVNPIYAWYILSSSIPYIVVIREDIRSLMII